MQDTKDAINVVFIGASFNTGNLGVSALAWSAIYLIARNWPDVAVSMLGGRESKIDIVSMRDHSLDIVNYPVRYCKNLLAENHIWRSWLGLIIYRVFGRNFLVYGNNKSTLRTLLDADVICDITGGDSFSDIYGMGRLIRGYLLKRICQLTGKPFIMLPQTYGPFKSPLAKWMAKRILKRATRIYSRDREGLQVVESLIGKTDKLRLCPDVAFILEPAVREKVEGNSEKAKELVEIIQKLKTNKKKLIGLNISGLLYSGGYTRKNEFGLQGDYRQLLQEIVSYFTSQEDIQILLVPHVVPENWPTEDDLLACHKLRDSLPEEIRSKILIAEPGKGVSFFDQCEIKYLIGQCDFFLGSRMHATIAAISQCIPTVGLAYSKKFAGVYETAEVKKCVADLRNLNNTKVLNEVKAIYEQSDHIKLRLEMTIPEVKQKVYAIFDDL